MTMEVAIGQDTQHIWNAFVEQSSDASVFHLFEWQTIIQQTYDHQAFYLAVKDGYQLKAILPLFLIKSRLFGRALVSMPFADYGGICGNGDPEVSSRLLEEAVRLGQSLSADYLQLRQMPSHESGNPPFPGLTPSDEKVSMLLELDPDTELIWKRLPSERRNRIKKGRQLGLRTRFVGAEALDEFYLVFSENMRDLGSPVHSKMFFKTMLALLGDRAKLLLVDYQDKIIGAALCLFFKGTILIPWVSSLRHYFRYSPNMLLYWAAIQYGCEYGYKILDFGRSSKDSGTYEFKRQWGAHPVTLPWQGISFHGGSLPSFSKKGLKERLLVFFWKRLPLTVTRYVGPLLRRSIPA